MKRGIPLLLLALFGCNKAEDVEVPLPEPTPPPPWDCEVGDPSAPDVSSFNTSALPDDLLLLDLGAHPTTCGFSEPLSFELPEGATSATLVLFGNDASVTFPASLTAPDGTVVIDFDPMAELTQADQVFGPLADNLKSDNPVFPRGSKGAVLVPNNDGVNLPSGTWSIELASWRQFIRGASLVAAGQDASVHAYVLVRTEPIADAGFDLALHFSGSNGLTAATAPEDPNIIGAIAAIETAYAPLGITVGDITYTDLPAGYDGVLQLDNSTCLASPEVEALLSSPTNPSPNSLNVFFIEGFSCNPSGTFDFGSVLAGLSNGLPGVPFSTADGVMVSTQWMIDLPDVWAKVLAHETGHFLGLFHTTELTGVHFDPIADTPEGATSNLMFWDASQNPGVFELTEEQGRVLRNHPLLRPLD